jgi:hypothetical protein
MNVQVLKQLKEKISEYINNAVKEKPDLFVKFMQGYKNDSTKCKE